MKKLAFILCACAIAWGYDSIDEALENGVLCHNTI